MNLVQERGVRLVEAERDYRNDEKNAESEKKIDKNADREAEEMKDAEGYQDGAM